MDSTPDITDIKEGIRKISAFNAVTVKEIILHFQALVSAGSYRLSMHAPGLYYPSLDLYVISKSGMNRGHTSMNAAIQPLLPPDKNLCYGFVLYPESFVRTCLDRLLRRTTKNITRDLRISMENVFNTKYHNRSLVDSDIERVLIRMLQEDAGVQPKKQIALARSPET